MMGLWDLLTLKENELSLIQESQRVDFQSPMEILLENFAQQVAQIYGWKYIGPKCSTYTMLFLDIKNSTRLITENPSKATEIFKFLKLSLEVAYKYFNPDMFKLVGDGILFLLDDWIYTIFDKEVLKELYEAIKKEIKSQGIPSIDFRIVGGYGELYCIEFQTQSGSLKECIGFPMSCLVKRSKRVDKHEWFDKLTPEKCNF